MRVTDWMSTDPVTVTPDMTVAEARKVMRLRGVRHLPVVEEGQLMGMLSDRDVRITDIHLEDLATADEPGRITGHERQVREAMSTPVHVVALDASIDDAARMMLSRRISSVPVLASDGSLAGLVTTTDCLLAFLSPEAEAARGETD